MNAAKEYWGGISRAAGSATPRMLAPVAKALSRFTVHGGAPGAAQWAF